MNEAVIQQWLAGRQEGEGAPVEERLPPRTLLRTASGCSQHRLEAFDTAAAAADAVHVAVLAQ